MEVRAVEAVADFRHDRVEAARVFREEALREGFTRIGVARAQVPAPPPAASSGR